MLESLIRLAVAVAMSLCTELGAAPGWVYGPHSSLPGVEPIVAMTRVVDLDGAGPQQPTLVAGGFIGYAGDARVNGIASWDGAQWSRVGQDIGFPGQPGWVESMGTFRGDLYAFGSFRGPTVQSETSVAIRWNGSLWERAPFLNNNPAASSPRIFAVAEHRGDLIVGGDFSEIDGQPIRAIARWNGETFLPLGEGLGGSFAAVSSMLVVGDDIIVAGSFETAGGAPAVNIARWDGESWSPLGDGLGSTVSYSFVAGLLAERNEIVAYGLFEQSGTRPVEGIARWDGADWSPVLPPGESPRAVFGAVATGDRLFLAITEFDQSFNYSASQIVAFDGAAIHPIADDIVGGGVYALTLFRGSLIASGDLSRIGGIDVKNIAAWDGAAWSRMGQAGTNGLIFRLAEFRGQAIATGDFTSIEGVAADRVASWDGDRWRPVPGVRSIGAMRTWNDRLVATGVFDAINPSTPSIAAWDGERWSPFGENLPASLASTISTFTVWNGDLYAGRSFYWSGSAPAPNSIVRWTGSAWEAIPSALTAQQYFYPGINALCQFGDALIAVGGFTSINGVEASTVAMWDGARWTPLPGLQGAGRVAIAYRGDLYVSTSSASQLSLSGLARWDGTRWNSMTGGAFWFLGLNSLAEYNGDLIIGGQFRSLPDGSPGVGIARWNGAEWSSMNSGLDSAQFTTAFALLPFRGELLVGGNFAFAGGSPSAYFARWSDTGIPWIARQPTSARADCDQPAPITLTVAPASGYGPLTYTWRRNGTPIIDSPPRIVGQGTPTLTIAPASFADSGSYDVVIANTAGEAASTPAAVIATIPGDANADGTVNAEDLMVVLGNYGAASAPWTGGDITGDGRCDFFDLSAVLGRYGEQCPR